MEPNTDFDNNNTTTMPEPTMDSSVRVVNLSQKEIAAYTAMGWNNARLAKHFGVSTTDIYRAKERFGLYTVRNPKAAKAPEYVINLHFDMPTFTDTVDNEDTIQA